MKNILVSGASGIVGYGALRSLGALGDRCRRIGTAIYADSVAPAFCEVFERAPMTVDAGYLEWLCSVIERHRVDMVIPGIEVDMYAWTEHRGRIQDAGAVCLLNNPELIALCGDKWHFYERLAGTGSAYAIESRLSGGFRELASELGLPFLLKPRRGYASRGIVLVDSEAVFDEHAAYLGERLMAQPLVGDAEQEYTTSAFFTAGGELRCHMTLRRKLSREGFTEKAEVAEVDGMEAALRSLAAVFEPVGPTNFQFRRGADGGLKLLEINPRISSATSIRSAFGYNEAVMSVEYFLEGRIPVQPVVRKGVAIRYTEEHVFYDRDHL